MTRTQEVSWIVDYLDDLDADFRVFYGIHGVGDGRFGGLSAPRFVMLAERTVAYQGVMRARLEQEMADDQQPAARRAASGEGGKRRVGSSRTELRADPAMAAVIDFG